MNNSEIIEKLEKLKLDIINKKNRLFFVVADTGGVPMASVEYIYRIAKLLNDRGHKVIMVHNKDKFIGVQNWLGFDYANLPHISIERMSDNKNMQIVGSDYFFVPELYSDFFKKLYESKLPSETVIICQSHTFIFKYLTSGEMWKFFNIDNVITTSSKMKKFLEEYQPVNDIQIINPPITKEFFEKSQQPQKPIITIIGRNPDESERLIKLFHQKYPMYSWFSFRTLGNMTKRDFADAIKESCLSIWLDDYATFGTFPLESMACGVPVIAKIPDLIPEWAEKIVESPETMNLQLENNAVYLSNILAMPDYIAKFVESWLLDDINQDIYVNMEQTAKKYTEENFAEQTINVFENLFNKKIQKINLTKAKYEQQISDNNTNS